MLPCRKIIKSLARVRRILSKVFWQFKKGLSDMKNINHKHPATNTGYAAIHYSNRGVSIASFLVQQNQLVASNNFIRSDRGNSFSPLFLLL